MRKRIVVGAMIFSMAAAAGSSQASSTDATGTTDSTPVKAYEEMPPQEQLKYLEMPVAMLRKEIDLLDARFKENNNPVDFARAMELRLIAARKSAIFADVFDSIPKGQLVLGGAGVDGGCSCIGTPAQGTANGR